MSALSVGRAPSGARLVGDDVQHLIAWYHALCTQRVDNRVVSLAVEATGAGNVDDLTLEYSDGPGEYWQVKASVDASTPVTQEWLFERSKSGHSLLHRLYESWQHLSRGQERPRIVLATTKSIDPTDRVLAYRATIDCRLADTMRAAVFARDRQRWAKHLGVAEDGLLDFLESFEIHHGQTEREWRTKVIDAAYGAGVQRSDAAIALGVQRVRDWVKRPRTTFTPPGIAEVLDSLKIRDAGTRRLFVAQALEPNPKASTATYATDWIDLFEGDDARNRRVLKDPGSAQRVRSDLAVARHRFRAAGVTDVLVDGPMRLPLWFTVGSELGRTAGFALSASVGPHVWTSDAVPESLPGGTLTATANPGDDLSGRPWVVSVNVSWDIEEDVVTYAAGSVPDAVLLSATVPSPGGNSVRDQEHAVGLAVWLRDELRRRRRELSPPEIHLFLAVPGALALFSGHLWDRMPPTTVYWDSGEPGQYVPAFRV